MFSYSITIYFIPNYKSYNSNFNPHSVYQTCPKFCPKINMENNEATNKVVNWFIGERGRSDKEFFFFFGEGGLGILFYCYVFIM